ncbi:hypothetical protein DID80_01095 [Candidatus Marinamargulisbacteria bacterium SCGC AAA071-K20]|nr:hypothetical protein DID80_01095 [Candidatus Marinamargulisbacteria bacterium SCGC AAA071-K20]
MLNCPLCESDISTNSFYSDSKRSYLNCSNCDLVFVDPQYHLDKAKEKARYDIHINSPFDSNYRQFLSQTLEPMLKLIPKKSKGLDFGCGPGPTLHLMFEEHGHSMSIYDPFYATEKKVLTHQYDFITATEVVEHLYTPLKTLAIVWDCLKPNGMLAIMTQRQPEDFSKWGYINDCTHVSFFSEKSFDWLENYWKAKIVFKNTNVVIFKKCNNT